MQISYLYMLDFPFKNVCKLAQLAEKNVWEKSMTHTCQLIRVQTMINHILICFYDNINIKENGFSEHELKKDTYW